jgi:outer membrane usher protein
LADEFFVARRGETFLTGLSGTHRVTVDTGTQTCLLKLALPVSRNPDTVLRIGPLRCERLAP